MKRLAESGDRAVEVHGGGRDEGHAEDSIKNLANITIGEFDLVAHKNGCCLCNRPYKGISEFVWRGLEDRTATLGTEGSFVNKLGYKCLGLQNDILLTAGLLLPRRTQ